MSSSQTNDSPQVKFALSFVHAIGNRDADLLADHLHTDFHRIIYPRSLNRPEYDKGEWVQQYRELMGFWTENTNASC